MAALTLDRYLEIADSKGYPAQQTPGSVILVGWRSATSRVNHFDDELSLYRFDGVKWYTHIWPITTLPGTYWLKNLLNRNGTAVLKAGCYEHAYALGMYRGYKALRQVRPVTVYRDNNLDSQIARNTDTIETGLFGIHIHRGGWFSRYVDRWSAGCQVFQKQKDFADFILLCEEASFHMGNKFTYTLIEI